MFFISGELRRNMIVISSNNNSIASNIKSSPKRDRHEDTNDHWLGKYGQMHKPRKRFWRDETFMSK